MEETQLWPHQCVRKCCNTEGGAHLKNQRLNQKQLLWLLDAVIQLLQSLITTRWHQRHSNVCCD